mgnify:CR=1 FL=1|jgi:perosamine synthetase
MKKKFKEFNSFGIEEVNAAHKVVKTGVLSGFIANHEKEFYGGKYVKKLEEDFKKYFNCKYAISVNSWTSGLVCAVGALNIKPGDEIIVSPWTMSATATAIIAWGGIPIFSEIDLNNYCLDPKHLENKINKRTKAIMVTDIFGQSADYKNINTIAKKYKLKVISDTAQAIGSKQSKKYSGTLSDIGGFSLNRHKHIHCGEGGIVLTNDKNLANNVFKIRNHGEVINNDKKFRNLIGYNLRLNEIEAAIAIVQLKKLKKILNKKIKMAELLSKNLKKCKGLTVPNINGDYTNVYYSYPIKVNDKITKKSKKEIFNMLKNEGVPINDKYVNLLEYKLYQNKNLYNEYPWIYSKKKNLYSKKNKVYKQINFLNRKVHLDIAFCKYDFSENDINFISNAFYKVWKKLKLL